MARRGKPLAVYLVHGRHQDRHLARLVRERSFEGAALLYLEDNCHGSEVANEIRLIVRHVASGHEHCFRIDLDSGEAAPC